MIKAKLTWRRGQPRSKIVGRNTSKAEAAVLIATICRSFEEKAQGIKAEEVLRAAEVALQIARKEDEKPGGLKVACHKDADGCKDLGPTGKCARFGCMCEDVHSAEEWEDE